MITFGLCCRALVRSLCKKFLGIKDCLIIALFLIVNTIITVGSYHLLDDIPEDVIGIFLALLAESYAIGWGALNLSCWILFVWILIYVLRCMDAQLQIDMLDRDFCDGQPIFISEDDLTVICSEEKLIPYKEYQIIPNSYENNTNRGIAKCKIVGKRKYLGIYKVVFRIV